MQSTTWGYTRARVVEHDSIKVSMGIVTAFKSMICETLANTTFVQHGGMNVVCHSLAHYLHSLIRINVVCKGVAQSLSRALMLSAKVWHSGCRAWWHKQCLHKYGSFVVRAR